MKIDRRNPAHWVYAGLFGLAVLVGALSRAFPARPDNPLVILYGHKLNGNLRALYDRLVEADDFDVVYLTPDPAYRAQLAREGTHVGLGFSRQGVMMMARAFCVATSHGPQLMAILMFLTGVRFVDVWHGIPFKGWHRREFGVMHSYDETWVVSALLKQIYVERYGFDPSRVRVTGYGRTDKLVSAFDTTALKRQLDLDERKVVLFAPTWDHGADGSTIPFGMDPESFYRILQQTAAANDAVCVVRAHMNTKLEAIEANNLRFLSHREAPDTEAVLQATDVLVCDWSSISFDFLLLDRPTIFLDVPAPFSHGFTLDPSYRFGAIVGDIATLQAKLAEYLDEPASYQRECGERAGIIKESVYGAMADGRASERYVEALRSLV